MNRRKLLKSLGAIGLGTLVPFQKSFGESTIVNKSAAKTAGCWLTPAETAGPFYFNPDLVRSDIREDTASGTIKTGVQLNMKFNVINSSCEPIPGVLVDIWHNDKDGAYSGYPNQPGGVNTVGQNFLRGIQATDAEGECSFISIYPGWYPGRVTHVHFKVRLNSNIYVTSQFAFPDEINTAVYKTPLYSGRGQNSVTNSSDPIFQHAEPEHQLMEITENPSTGGYDGTFTIGINAVTDVKDYEQGPEGFLLEQNYPNPFNPSTKIKYHLPFTEDVKLTVFDVFGRDVATLVDKKQSAGIYEVEFNAGKISSGFYFYKLSAGNNFKVKEMLLLK